MAQSLVTDKQIKALVNDYGNHFIDPMFFAEAIEMFAFNYVIFRCVGLTKDATYKQHYDYQRDIIHGSLQSLGLKVHRSKEGNYETYEFNFYCRSLYRIAKNDVIKYKDKYLLVDELFNDYDEAGVRAVHLTMHTLESLKDFDEWLAYQEGRKIV